MPNFLRNGGYQHPDYEITEIKKPRKVVKEKRSPQSALAIFEGPCSAHEGPFQIWPYQASGTCWRTIKWD
jgi:hypothetical protein